MTDLFNTGIRPIVDAHLAKLAEEKRDYGDYWSASTAGYCMRRNIFERLKVPYVSEDARKHRVFAVGDIFHEFIQRITKEAGLSIAQELELQDEDLMIRGHIDDLVLVNGQEVDYREVDATEMGAVENIHMKNAPHLILYDYKSVSSRSFQYKTDKPSYFHKMQVGTYMYMLRQGKSKLIFGFEDGTVKRDIKIKALTEARLLLISKDDLRQKEQQVLWSDELEEEVLTYWKTLNKWWKSRKMPPCTCAAHEGGFLAKEAYNPFYYNGEPCSLSWYELNKKKEKV